MLSISRELSFTDYSVTQGAPSLVVNLPVQTWIRSTSQPIPKHPPVRSQIMPVPIFSCHKAVNAKSAEEKRNKYCRSFVHNKILLYPINLKYNRIYSTSQRCNTNTFYHTHAFLSIAWRITVEIWRKTA